MLEEPDEGCKQVYFPPLGRLAGEYVRRVMVMGAKNRRGDRQALIGLQLLGEHDLGLSGSDFERCQPRGRPLTGSLIPGHLLTRDSESFGPRFRGPTLTLKVQVGPRVVSLELETFSPAANLSQVLTGKAINAKTPKAETLGVLC